MKSLWCPQYRTCKSPAHCNRDFPTDFHCVYTEQCCSHFIKLYQMQVKIYEVSIVKLRRTIFLFHTTFFKPASIQFSFCPNPCFNFLFLDLHVHVAFIYMTVIAYGVKLTKNYFGWKCYFVKNYTFKHLSSCMCNLKNKSRLLPIEFFVVIDHESSIISFVEFPTVWETYFKDAI